MIRRIVPKVVAHFYKVAFSIYNLGSATEFHACGANYR